MPTSRRDVVASLAGLCGSAGGVFGLSGCAQAPRAPGAPTPAPADASWPRAALHPALHLVGDSTMADKPLGGGNPERGWGQLLGEWLLEPARLVNHAANGRSSKSFIDEGRWAHVLAQLQPGDFVLIQFGHNDQKADDPRRHADAAEAYPRNLRRMLADAQARGASPLLATSVVRRKFDAAGRLLPTLGEYPQALRHVAAAQRVPLLDLERASRQLVQGLGPEAAKTLYMWIAPGAHAGFPKGLQDDTHFVEQGARALASLAVQALREQGHPLVHWMRPR